MLRYLHNIIRNHLIILIEAGDPCISVSCPVGSRCVASLGQPECRCPRSCQRRKVVCGTDGKEYPSACHLDKHACDNQLNITIKYHGKCGKLPFVSKLTIIYF